jgi:hypothetical protein
MKLRVPDRRAGEHAMLLIQLVVYMACASLVVTLSVVAFWNAFTAVRAHMRTAEDASLLLRAGELWRDDIRASDGRIRVEPAEQGTRCRIGGGKQAVVWTWSGDQFSRAVEAGSATNVWARGLAEVNFLREERGSVVVWRLDATLAQGRTSERRPVAFTFRSVPVSKEAP